MGDDDGLCESNEVCLQSKNIGSYQGHNSTLFDPFDVTFTDGDTLIGITLKEMPDNGY